MCDVMVSYYATAMDAIYDTNRKLHSFPAPDDFVYGRDGTVSPTEAGRALLLDYDIEDPDVIANCIIMYVEKVI